MTQRTEMMKVAEATAIYKNIDYTLLKKSAVQKRFKALLVPLLPKIFYKKEAFWAMFKILVKVIQDPIVTNLLIC